MFTCDELLSHGLDDYSTDEGGYNPTCECFHIDHEEHDRGNQLDMPQENDMPPPYIGESRELSEAQTPSGSHVAHLEKLCEVQAKHIEEEQRLQQLWQVLEKEAAIRSLKKAHVPRHVPYVIALWKMPRPTHPQPFTGLVNLTATAILLCTMPDPSTTDAKFTVKFGDSWSVLLSSRPRAQLLSFGSPPQSTKRDPLASRGRFWSIPNPPMRKPPRYKTASRTIASIEGSTTASTNVFITMTGDTRHVATTLSGVAATIAGRIETHLLSCQVHRSSAGPSTGTLHSQVSSPDYYHQELGGNKAGTLAHRLPVGLSTRGNK